MIERTVDDRAAFCPRTAWLASLVLWICLARLATAAPVSGKQAGDAVRAWLARTPAPLGQRLGAPAGAPQAIRDSQGIIIYYVVKLTPQGFVIVAADDLVEPVIGFFPGGTFDPSPTHPLGFLAGRDLAGRVTEARAAAAASKASGKVFSPQGTQAAAQQKWNQLLGLAKPLADLNAYMVDDLRVPPLVQSQWGQDGLNGIGLYNYYTPPNAAGSAANFPSGCMATAMAQLMRFHQWPATGIGVKSYFASIKGVSQELTVRGGNGSGGPYNWASMVLNPAITGVNTAERQAIGALVYDCAVSIQTDFTTASSSASMQTAHARLTDLFNYSNCVYSSNYSAGQWRDLGAAMPAMINPNLDSGLPVILSIRSTTTDAGHAVVCDGYGYNAATIYHHVNLGWTGTMDGWYNLPSIGTPHAYDTVIECLYNIYTSGSGEIISGRVLDAGGVPIAGATVTATHNSIVATTTQTQANSEGIFAFKQLYSNAQYSLSATAPTYTFGAPRLVRTGLSKKSYPNDFPNPTSGNIWGADLQAQPDAYPRVEITSATTNRREDSGVVTLIVARSAAADYASVVSVTVSGGTAKAGADFTLNPASVTIAAGQTQASFAVQLVDDATGEPVETAELAIVPSTGCLPGRKLTHTLTIVDEDNFLAEALDQFQIFWQTRGDAPWAGQTATSHDGADGAQSGTIEPGQESTLYAYVTGPGTLGFWWSVAAPAGDRLIFNDNGTTVSIAGTIAFQQRSIPLGAGVHLLQWTLRRAAGSPAGPSSGWVDQVTWTGGVPPATPPTPFLGAPHAIPGPIEAEDFDLGGNSAAYYDSTPGNTGAGYRTGDDVDLFNCTDLDNGYYVGNIASHEWLGYTVGVSQAGLYTVRLRVASAPGARCRLDLGGADLAGEIILPATGGGQVWHSVELAGVPLPAGTGVLRLTAVTGGFNLNRIDILPETGFLKMDISPSGAIAAGAKWRRVGTTLWRGGGTTEEVSTGACTVEFKDVPGWGTPAKQNLWIVRGQTTARVAWYTQQYGSLKITIDPAGAVQGGARWKRVEAETWNESGTTEGVPAGPHTLEFKAVAGWRRPDSMVVNVPNQQLLSTAAAYVPAGSLTVNLLPAQAAGAQWRRVGTTAWLAGGATETEVPAGEQRIEFKAPAGWNPPPVQTAQIVKFQLTQATGNFIRQTGGLRVNITPAAAVTAGARWRRVGTSPWLASGATEPGLPTGSYPVEFKAISGWKAPTTRSATVQNTTTTTLSVIYTVLKPSAVGRGAWMGYR